MTDTSNVANFEDEKKKRAGAKASKRTYVCKGCGEAGHNRRTCPKEQGGDGKAKASADKPEKSTGVTAKGSTVVDVGAEAAARKAIAEAGPMELEEAERLREEVIERWDAWRQAIDAKRAVDREAKDARVGKEEELREIMETGPDATQEIEETDSLREAAMHLAKAQRSWLALQETKATYREKKRAARERVSHCQQALEDAIENSRQLKFAF
jgi:hypothetical protein